MSVEVRTVRELAEESTASDNADVWELGTWLVKTLDDLSASIEQVMVAEADYDALRGAAWNAVTFWPDKYHRDLLAALLLGHDAARHTVNGADE